MPLILLILAVPLVAAGIAVTATARAITRITVTRRREHVLAVTDTDIAFVATATTQLPGVYAVITPDGAVHAQIGDIIGISGDGAVVRRQLLHSTGALHPGPVRWSGMVYLDPSQLSPAENAAEVRVRAPSGPAPSWLINDASDSDVWVIHIHGQGATRASVLRGVPACTRAGLTSLVVSYYGDGEAGGGSGPQQTTFGQYELPDVEAAARYALDRGARRLILVGWSLGANLAIRLATASTLPIAGLVVIAPPLDFAQVLEHHRERIRWLPSWVLKAALIALRTPTRRMLGINPGPIRLAPSLLNEPLPLPRAVLAITSSGDLDVPADQLQRFVRLNPTVTLAIFPPVPHTMEWNRDPQRWEQLVGDLLLQAVARDDHG